DPDKIEWCKWLISGGVTFDEFSKTVGQYDDAVTCGLVWTSNFVAYRCRTCGISPCMSLCFECFQGGNHEGHDYNMFRSHAGGACDCGDISVMDEKGFCCRHGPSRKTKNLSPPADLMFAAEIIIPRLIMRLLYHLRDSSQAHAPSYAAPYLAMVECEKFVDFLHSLADMGAAMRKVIAKSLTNPQIYEKMTTGINGASFPLRHTPCIISVIEKEDESNRYFVQNQKSYQTMINMTLYPDSFNRYHGKLKHLFSDLPREINIISITGKIGLSQRLSHESLLDELIFWSVRYYFPTNINTLLLKMLPEDEYKIAFAKGYVKHYSRMSLLLSESRERVKVANRVVHISVQLFSNEVLAYKMCEDYNLLYIMVLSLTHMLENVTINSTLEDMTPEQNFHAVVDCSHDIMKDHCYWSIMTDFNNLLSHRSIALKFLQDEELVTLWIDMIVYLQGMNLNQRELFQHVEFEPDSYYAAFTAELELSALPMWSILSHCKTSETSSLSLRMIAACQTALQDWFDAINCKESSKPNPNQLSFHLPLHRYLAVFMMQAVQNQGIELTTIIPDEDSLKKILIHVLQIQVCLSQIHAGLWVRNGVQIRGQAMTYVQSNFCYSLSDLDIHLIQVCASKLDPDYFVSYVLKRYNVFDWLSFSPTSSYNTIPLTDDQEINMVESVLAFFTALVSTRTYLGNPGRTKELFDPTLNEIADFKAPNFEVVGGMQQGTYVPKGFLWENEYDPVKVTQRAIHKEDLQVSLDRYTQYIKKHHNYKKKTVPWPPFRVPGDVHHAYKGLYKILNSKTMHAFLFTVLYKAVNTKTWIPDSILYYCIHLLYLAFHYTPRKATVKKASAGTVGDCEFTEWFSNSDIRHNVNEIINEVCIFTPTEVPPGAYPMETEDTYTVDTDMDSNNLEEMFQIASIAVVGRLNLMVFSLETKGNPGARPKYQSRGVCTTSHIKSAVCVIKESMVTLLMKLHNKLSSKPGSYKPIAVQNREPITSDIGDGPHFVARLLDRIASTNSECSFFVNQAYSSCLPEDVKEYQTHSKADDSEKAKEERRRKAMEKQRKLLANFASKQKAFMEQAMDDEGKATWICMEVPEDEGFDCVICYQSTPSTAERPVGLVVFNQATSVLAHCPKVEGRESVNLLEKEYPRYSNRGMVQRRQLEELIQNFDERSCQMSVNIGWEGGVIVQSCGHYLHLDCHHSYVKSLKSQESSIFSSVKDGEYYCPLCRQLSNSVIPIVPEENKQSLVKPISEDPRQMVIDIAEMMVTRPITPVSNISGSELLTKAMGSVMEDLLHTTYAKFRTYSYTSSECVYLLFVCSVARSNLELELIQLGGNLKQISQLNIAKKSSFLPLLHVLSLHSKILTLSPTPYTPLWSHITGVTCNNSDDLSLSLYQKDVPLLLKDMTALLIQFVLTLPFTIKEEHFSFVLQMLYNALYVQALTVVICKFGFEERKAWGEKGRHATVDSLEGMLSHLITRINCSRLFEQELDQTFAAICQSVWSPQSVEMSLQEHMLPFLRMAVILKHHLFKTIYPENQNEAEYIYLCKLLNLVKGDSPPSKELTSSSLVRWAAPEPIQLTRAWCVHFIDFVNTSPAVARSLLMVNQVWYRPKLIPLPKEYYQIFQHYRSKTCVECKRTPKDPTLCLVCGKLICFREDCCKQNSTGECTQHSVSCGGSTGIFLLVNSSIIVVIRGARATIWGSVYLDDHGEEDKDLRRGKPLYLSKERYTILEQQWLNHNFNQVCKNWSWH
ncbi:hypothetical protein LOTGIDRAFT_51305, partial [Lottia gigantea]